MHTMNRLFAIVVVLAASFTLSSCSLGDFVANKSNSTIKTAPVIPSPTTSPVIATSSNLVTIDQMQIVPSTITVKKGSTVIWLNQDSSNHRLVSNLFDSAILSTDDKFNYVTDKVGTIDYHCSIHSSMTGKIIVTE